MSESKVEKKIMLVEDAVDLQILMKKLFEDEGYEVFCASNGKEALDLLRTLQELPKVIFLDLMMPIMDGAAFVEEQKKDHRLADIPVVLMTADGRVAEKTVSIGANNYIRKPADVEEILSLAHRYCF